MSAIQRKEAKSAWYYKGKGKSKKDTIRSLAKDGMPEKDGIQSPIPSDSAKATNLTANVINSASCESSDTTAEKVPVSGLCTNPMLQV